MSKERKRKEREESEAGEKLGRSHVGAEARLHGLEKLVDLGQIQSLHSKTTFRKIYAPRTANIK
eukprot:scaffold163389_cov19-Prasinocladus_malaysianus.AAC.1